MELLKVYICIMKIFVHVGDNFLHRNLFYFVSECHFFYWWKILEISKVWSPISDLTVSATALLFNKQSRSSFHQAITWYFSCFLIYYYSFKIPIDINIRMLYIWQHMFNYFQIYLNNEILLMEYCDRVLILARQKSDQIMGWVFALNII